MAEDDNSPANQRSKAIKGVTDPEAYDGPAAIDQNMMSRQLFEALSQGGSTAELGQLLLENSDDPTRIAKYIRIREGIDPTSTSTELKRFLTDPTAEYDLWPGPRWSQWFLNGVPGQFIASSVWFGDPFDLTETDEERRADVQSKALEEIKEQLQGFERLTEDQKLELTEEFGYPGDFDMIIDLYDAGNVLGQRLPLQYGNLSLTERGLFAETPSYKTRTAEQIKTAFPDWDDQRINDLLTPPFDSSAGRALGAMTARYASIMVPISQQRAQAMGYAQDSVGQMERVDWQLLGPDQEAPAGVEAWGPEAEVEISEGEFVFGIDDALAYYEALEPEQQREFATSLLALGWMDDQKAAGVEWLLNPDQVFTDEAVRGALRAAANSYVNEMSEVFGVDTPTMLEETGVEGEARGKFIPMLGRPGGMFDTEEAEMDDFESFIRQARITAGYLSAVPVESISQTINDWSWENLGRSADPGLIRMGLEIATGVAEKPSNIKPGGAEGYEIAAGVEAGLFAGADEEELERTQNASLNRILTAYLARSAR